jgi:hypothetical protein
MAACTSIRASIGRKIMEAQKQEQGKIIHDVGLLDLRKATEESIAGISRIQDVGMVLYSAETAGLVGRLSMGDVGASMEATQDARLLTGQVLLTSDSLKSQAAPAELLVTGQVVVGLDVSAEEIEKGLDKLTIVGQLICPEHLLGVVQSRLPRFTGQVVAYSSSTQLTVGRLILDENTLSALDDASKLTVVGSLRLPQVLPNDQLKQKIESLHIVGSIRCHEENVQVILDRLTDKSVKVTTIPTGFELVERPLLLDNNLLESLPSAKLYCTDRVRVDPEVDPTLLDERLEAVITQNTVICPAELRSVMAGKCNLLETQAIFYDGELWLVDGEDDLVASRFDYLEGQATLVVVGELTIDSEVAPRMLADRLAKVHNLGVIRCTAEQRGAIQARLGLSEGVLKDSTQVQAPEHGIGDVGYLVL